MEFKNYKRTNVAEMTPVTDEMIVSYVRKKNLTIDGVSVSISAPDLEHGSPKIGDMIARNPYNHEDMWLVSREYFEVNFEEAFPKANSEGLSFGSALLFLKKGHRVARKGWNGKGMFLFLLPAGTVPTKAIHDPALRNVIEENVGGDTFEALGSIRMFTADKKILTGWLASQTDMLSEDWMILS